MHRNFRWFSRSHGAVQCSSFRYFPNSENDAQWRLAFTSRWYRDIWHRWFTPVGTCPSRSDSYNKQISLCVWDKYCNLITFLSNKRLIIKSMALTFKTIWLKLIQKFAQILIAAFRPFFVFRFRVVHIARANTFATWIFLEVCCRTIKIVTHTKVMAELMGDNLL